MKSNTRNEYQQQAIFCLLFLLICRLLAMYFIPLNDSTEARYAEIARKMLETNNWITPFHDYGVPFWAKPPLSTWLSAFFMKGFGVSAFVARLPSLLFSIGLLWLVFGITKKRADTDLALTAVLILASSLAFMVNAGAVMTDPSLLFSTTLAFIAFWNAMASMKKSWGMVFFLSLGLGLLAKGPVVIILTGIPIFCWVVLNKQWRKLWQCLPWFTGIPLMLLVALPWYLIAETRTPGFLNYFIMGEHLGRFFVTQWQGDKYGFAHAAPYGMIIGYACLGILPWTFHVGYGLTYHFKKITSLYKDHDGWMSYWLCCALAPLVFFCFAKNVIWPYVLPSLPPFAILFAIYAKELKCPHTLLIAATSGVFILVATGLFIIKPEIILRSQLPVILAWQHQHPKPTAPLVYLENRSTPIPSAQFYANGHVMTAATIPALSTMLDIYPINYIVVDSTYPFAIPNKLKQHLTLVKTIPVSNVNYLLYRYQY